MDGISINKNWTEHTTRSRPFGITTDTFVDVTYKNNDFDECIRADKLIWDGEQFEGLDEGFRITHWRYYSAARKQSGIGDISSKEKGSGARFNSGKAPIELIPIRLIAKSLESSASVAALKSLGEWQEGGRDFKLLEVLSALGMEGWWECADVFSYGKQKYAAWNWAKGMPWSVPMACAARHLLKLAAGENNDQESGLPHRGHVFCNIVMLLTYIDSYPEGDDRPLELTSNRDDYGSESN